LVGYALNERMTKDPVTQALFRAVGNQKPKPGLALHSGRGSQYCARDYQATPAQFGMQPPMGRKGDCWEILPFGYNAPMGSFWGTLKNGLVHHRQCPARHQAKQEVTEYIEAFYLCPVGIAGNANKHDWPPCPLPHSPGNISIN
jgi:putative transposase